MRRDGAGRDPGGDREGLGELRLVKKILTSVTITSVATHPTKDAFQVTITFSGAGDRFHDRRYLGGQRLEVGLHRDGDNLHGAGHSDFRRRRRT